MLPQSVGMGENAWEEWLMSEKGSVSRMGHIGTNISCTNKQKIGLEKKENRKTKCP
jgi:hypothetical protein